MEKHKEGRIRNYQDQFIRLRYTDSGFSGSFVPTNLEGTRGWRFRSTRVVDVYRTETTSVGHFLTTYRMKENKMSSSNVRRKLLSQVLVIL